MTILTRFVAKAVLLILLGTSSQVLALDMEHIITLALRATAESEPIERGDNVTVVPISSRISTLNIIQAIGDARQINYTSRARLLLVRHDVGEESESSEVIIRQPGLPDENVDEAVLFEPFGSSVQYGTFNNATGRERTTLLYIATLILDIPDTAQLNMNGPATEKRASLRRNGEEINAGLSSLSARLAGDGFIVDEGEITVVVDGTMTVGAGKAVESNPL